MVKKKLDKINFDTQRMIYLLEQIDSHLYYLEDKEKKTEWMDKLHAVRGIIVLIMIGYLVYKLYTDGELTIMDMLKHLLTVMN